MNINNKYKTPIYDALINHKNYNRASFHTPGHKGRIDEIVHNLLQLDYTELPDTDSLYEASGCILKAEQKAADLFGCKRTLFSAGGCTLAIQTMLRLVCPNGGKIVCSRIIHKSAANSMCLLGIDPIFIYPKQDAGAYLPGRVDKDDIESVLKSNNDVCAVYITSPDYYGVMSDIKAISLVCKKYNVPLIVDNAHGAHLKFLGKMHPIDLGASMSACSAHKTLPVLTSGAFLNINDDRFIDEAKNAMSVFGSTSPSYPVMASLDICRQWLSENAACEYQILMDRVSDIKNTASKKGILQPSGLCDPTRIALNTYSIGINGNKAADMLRKQKIEPEYSNDKYVILIPTPFNTKDDFSRLKKAIENMNQESQPKMDLQSIPKVEKKMSLRDAFLSRFEIVDVRDSVNRVAKDVLSPCPPGIPVVMPGEVINENVVNFLLGYGFFKVKVVL